MINRKGQTSKANSPRRDPKDAGRRFPWRSASGVFALALAIRLLHIWQLQRAPFFSLLMGDAISYDAWARRIAAGDWLGTDVFYQAPLYPYFLGVLYYLFGHDLMLLRVCQALLGAGSCALITVASDQLFGNRAGLLAGLLLALYAPAIFFDALVQKSVLDLFFFCWLILLAALLSKRVTITRCILAGVALGGLTLARENALILLPVLLVWLALRGHRGFMPMVALVLGVGIVLAPVAIRNFRIGGEFYLTTSQFGPNLYIGNNPKATGTYMELRPGRGSAAYEQIDATKLAEEALGHKLSPGEVSQYWQKRAAEWISKHPGACLRLLAKKLLLLLNASEACDTEDLASHAEWSLPLSLCGMVFHFGTLAPLGLLGIWLTRARWRELWALYAMGAMYASSVVLFYILARYRYPLVPLLTIFAGAALTNLPAWWAQSNSRERLRTAILAAVVILACNWPLISTDEMRAGTRYNVASALQAEGRDDAAITEYRAALELWPESAGAHCNLGVLIAAKGDHDEALRHYKEAIRISPDMPAAYSNLGMEFAARGQYREAIENFQQALALDDLDATTHYNLGLAFAAVNRPEDATRQFADAIRLDPAHAAAHNNLGILLAAAGDLDEAIRHFETALSLRPNFSEAAANLARARALRSGK